MVNFFELEKRLICHSWFWPEDKFMTAKSKIMILFNAVIIWISIWGEISFAVANRNNLPVALNAICPVVSKLMLLSKVLLLHSFRHELKTVLIDFKVKMDQVMETEQKSILARPMKASNIASKCLAINIIITCAYYTLLPMVNLITSNIRGTAYEKQLPFKMLFPAPFDSNDFPFYEMKYFICIYVCHISLTGYVGVDGLFVGFCMQLAGHFKILQSDIANLDKQIENESNHSFEDNQKIRIALGKIIKRHAFLIELTQRVSNSFKYIAFVHFVAAALVIGITSINFLLVGWLAKLLFMNYMSGSFLHALMYAATGDFLNTSITEVSQKVYQFKWYQCDKKTQKDLLFMMMRSQSGTGIVVPFFEMNLSTFTNIVKTAGSYITLMNTLI